MQIDEQTIAELLQLGGQYFIPTAALLRAIYSGIRGNFPEGWAQIIAASFFAGLTAVADGQQPDIRLIILEVLGNTIFMAGLLAFIMTYLLRQPDRGQTFDGIVGSVVGAITFLVWVYLLGNDWPLWAIIFAIAAGAAAFIALRFSLRQIFRLVRIATWLIVIGIVLVALAGGVWLLQQVMTAPVAG